MDTVRGLTLWLVPALLASLICTAALHVLLGSGSTDLSFAFAFGLLALPLTVAGSTFLTLMYVRMRSTPYVLRYLALIALGCGAGAFALFWAPAEFKLVGMLYGGATACIWCVMHVLLYGSADR